MKEHIRNWFTVLAAVIMLTIISARADAAEEAALSSTSKTVWIGSGGYTFYVKDICEEDYTIYYTVEDKSMVSINYKTGHVKGISTGEDATTTFYAILIHNKTGEVTVLNTPLYVKEKASRVEISNKEMAEIALLPGDTVDFDAVMYNRAGQVTTTRGKYVTDYTLWASSDSTVATVNKNTGVVTAKKAGKVTIYVRTYVYANGTGNYSAEDSVDVYVVGSAPTVTQKPSPTVKPTAAPSPVVTTAPSVTVTPTTVPKDKCQIVSVRQLSTDSIEVIFNMDVSEMVTKSNLYVKNSNTTARNLVNKISFSKDGKRATVMFWNNLKADTPFTVIYGETSKEFTSSDGKIADLILEDSLITTQLETPIAIKAVDRNGVDLTTPEMLRRMSFECSYNAFFDPVNLTMTIFNDNDAAQLTVTYISDIYDPETESFPIYTATATYISVPPAPVEMVSLSINIGTKIDYKNPVTSLVLNDTDYYIYAKAEYSDATVRKTHMSEGDFTFKSSDPSKLLIIENTGAMIPIGTGDVSVLVFDGDTVLEIYKLEIMPARKVTKTALSKATVNLTAGLLDDTAKIVLNIYDQYGNLMEPEQDISIQQISSNSTAIVDISDCVEGNVINIDGSVFMQPGTYYYRVVYEDITKTLVIKANTAGSAKSYRLTLSETVIDSTCTEGEEIEKEIVAKLFSYDSRGNKVELLDRSSVGTNMYVYGYSVTKADGTIVSDVAPLPADGIISIPIVDISNDLKITKKPEGKYIISIYLSQNGYGNNVYVANAYFSVTDSQETPTLELASRSLAYSEAENPNAVFNCFTLNGKATGATDDNLFILEEVDSEVVGDKLWVKTIIIYEYYNGAYISHTFENINEIITLY